MVLLDFAHGFSVLPLLEIFLLLKVFVARLQVSNIIVLLLIRDFKLLSVALFVLCELGLHPAFGRIELSLQLLLLLLPLLHLTLFDEHDVCQLWVHHWHVIGVVRCVIIELVDLVSLFYGHSTSMSGRKELTALLRNLLLLDVVDEEVSIFASREQEARVLGANQFCYGSLMREGPTHASIHVWV